MADEPTGCTTCDDKRGETVQEYTRRRLLEAKPAVSYLTLYPALRDAARACGYALAVHGSLARDFDLIAVPWTDDAADVETLVTALCEAGELFIRPTERGEPKAHGRLAYTLLPGGVMWVDLSVMPRAGTPTTEGGETP